VRIAEYYVVDKSILDEDARFNTKHKAWDAANEINQNGLFEAVVVKVMVEKKEDVATNEVGG